MYIKGRVQSDANEGRRYAFTLGYTLGNRDHNNSLKNKFIAGVAAFFPKYAPEHRI
jgi:hypothetical protein